MKKPKKSATTTKKNAKKVAKRATKKAATKKAAAKKPAMKKTAVKTGVQRSIKTAVLGGLRQDDVLNEVTARIDNAHDSAAERAKAGHDVADLVVIFAMSGDGDGSVSMEDIADLETAAESTSQRDDLVGVVVDAARGRLKIANAKNGDLSVREIAALANRSRPGVTASIGARPTRAVAMKYLRDCETALPSLFGRAVTVKNDAPNSADAVVGGSTSTASDVDPPGEVGDRTL